MDSRRENNKEQRGGGGLGEMRDRARRGGRGRGWGF